MLQTADSMFDEMTDVLGRMKDLSTQAANGTYNSDDLQAMQDEYDELGKQMSDMLENTTYGGTNLFGNASNSNTHTSGLFTGSVQFRRGRILRYNDCEYLLSIGWIDSASVRSERHLQ